MMVFLLGYDLAPNNCSVKFFWSKECGKASLATALLWQLYSTKKLSHGLKIE